jgi:hypothetical protein
MKRKLVLVAVVAIVGAFIVRHAVPGAPVLAPVATRSIRATPGHAAAKPPSLDAMTRSAVRAPEEWQGMQIDPDEQPMCEASERCGLATACVIGRCGACRVDADCATGEACVLEHCVPAARVACRGRANCREGELCVLSGISSDARGNSDMRAYCQGRIDIVQSRQAYDDNQRARVGVPAPPRPVTPQGLLDGL